MRTVKSRARKQDTSLTVTKATSQVRRHVDAIMPGAFATVDSKDSYDLDANTALVVTTVTFPRGHEARHLLVTTLATCLGGDVTDTDSRIVITRKR